MKKLVWVLAVMAALTLCSCGDKEVTEPAESVSAVSEEKALTESVITEASVAETPEISEKQEENGGETMAEAAKIYYQGHASMRIDTPEGKTIYVDPFMGDGYDVPADLILMTHGHHDHTQTNIPTYTHHHETF